MSTTRRSFLATLGLGLVAGPSLLKAALAKPALMLSPLNQTKTYVLPDPDPEFYRRLGQEFDRFLGDVKPFRPADYRGALVWHTANFPGENRAS